VKKSPTLIIAPHTDDEVLSTASFLEKDLKYVTIFYQTEDHPHFDISVLRGESDQLVKFLGCVKRVSKIDQNDLLDTIPIRDLINEYEELICDISPDTIILPNPSYNQDHRIVYEAALTALRPHDRIPFVKRVLIYEEPETFGTLRNVQPFRPQYFRKLDIDRKIKLIEFYQSQIRAHRSSGHIRAIAQTRGLQCNYEYAEAFEVLRWAE
jgi:LmbE family N-acetylglucosaminyl deacetylase